MEVAHQFPELFGDVPEQTSLTNYDIDVGSAAPIKRNPYCVNLLRREILKRVYAVE